MNVNFKEMRAFKSYLLSLVVLCEETYKDFEYHDMLKLKPKAWTVSRT
jgi:hypothetical protein